MKKTDILRQEREKRRAAKKQEYIKKAAEKKTEMSVGDYIKKLSSLLFHDGTKIYNISKSDEIKELIMEIKESVPEKQWDNVVRKSIKMTGVSEREPAIKELKGLFKTL